MFGKKKSQDQAMSRAPRQYPDELADAAAIEYGNGRFAAAAEGYANAIDKIHTMVVVASNPIRRPDERDQYILDGFRNSVGAAYASGQAFDRNVVDRALGYLSEIASTAGPEGMRYRQAITDVEYEISHH